MPQCLVVHSDTNDAHVLLLEQCDAPVALCSYAEHGDNMYHTPSGSTGKFYPDVLVCAIWLILPVSEHGITSGEGASTTRIRHPVPTNMYHQREEASRPRTSLSRLLRYSVRRALCNVVGFRKPRACFPTNHTSGVGRADILQPTNKATTPPCLTLAVSGLRGLEYHPAARTSARRIPSVEGSLYSSPEELCSAEPCHVKAQDLGRCCC